MKKAYKCLFVVLMINLMLSITWCSGIYENTNKIVALQRVLLCLSDLNMMEGMLNKDNTHNCTTFFSIVLTSNKPSCPKRCITL